MISVIIPVYNAEETIGRAIKSVINQPYVHQLILINDASTDNSNIIISYYKDKYFSPSKGIKLDIIQLEINVGVSVSRNKGLEYVQSPFLTFLDADDEESKIFYLRQFDPSEPESIIVPDPYSLPDRAFEEVLEMVEKSTDGLIAELLR